MYEHHSARMLPLGQFLRRLARHFGIVAGLMVVSLLGGMGGYAYFAGMSWIDAFLNASMLLGGMGPVGTLPNSPAKVFAGVYALYAGLVFIVSTGILVAPIVHRVMHKLHMEGKGQDK